MGLAEAQAWYDPIGGETTAYITPADAKAALSQTYADTSNALAVKANITYVDSRDALKADLTYVNTQLGLKADSSAVTSSLALKSDITYVDSQLALKANQSSVTSSLALKADLTYVNQSMPIGTILMWPGAAAPTGWHLCNGTAHGSSSLQSVLGSANTPDLRDRFIVGAGSSYAVAATGGLNTVTLGINEMPYHSHQWAAAGVNTPASQPANWDDAVGGDTAALGTGPADPEYGGNAIKPRGGGGAHENRPPYYALTYIIKKA